MPSIQKKIKTDVDYSFQLLIVDEPIFYSAWHFHPEYEIIFIQEGEGDRFVGESTEKFSAGDLTMFGPNIPHLFKSKHKYNESSWARAIVIYFIPEIFESFFGKTTESHKILELLQQSHAGLKFKSGQVSHVTEKMEVLPQKDGFERIIVFFEILHQLSLISERTLLTEKLISLQTDKDDQRLNKVYEYIQQNYLRRITLHEVSDVACMNPNAFCRYFKKRTNTSFLQFVLELRISHARKLLKETSLSVNQVSYETGFNNLNSFLYQFKRLTQLTPVKYRMKQIQMLS